MMAMENVALKSQVELQDREISDLRQAILKAESASKYKSQFVAQMSHEVRTPLNAILGYVDLIFSQCADLGLPPAWKEIIQRNGEQLSRIVDDVLDLSRMEAGKLSIERTQIDFMPFLHEVMSSLSLDAQKRGLYMRAHFANQLPARITSDPTRLRQILFNIISNSLKFTKTGGITINVTIDKSAHSARRMITISVQDTGIGIPRDAHERIFQPFMQGIGQTTKQFGGTGLGLMLSRHLAQAMDGDLQLVESAPDRGSCFVVTVDPGFIDLNGPTTAAGTYEIAGPWLVQHA